MTFELITGDFLFEPRKGPNYTKSDDHIAQMIEMLGPMPRNFAMSGKQFDHYFERTDKGIQLRRIKGLRCFPLKRLLTDKYRLKAKEAEMLADFLL